MVFCEIIIALLLTSIKSIIRFILTDRCKTMLIVKMTQETKFHKNKIKEELSDNNIQGVPKNHRVRRMEATLLKKVDKQCE